MQFFLWILLISFGTLSYSHAAEIDKKTLYDAERMRDPFTPLLSSAVHEVSGLLGVESIDDITVEGIVYDPKNGSVAIANGSVLKENEEIGNVKALKIEPRKVLFLVNGIEGYKSLYQEESENQQ